MTSEKLKSILERCADESLRQMDVDYAPRQFIASLSGALEALDEQALSDKLFSILDRDRS